MGLHPKLLEILLVKVIRRYYFLKKSLYCFFSGLVHNRIAKTVLINSSKIKIVSFGLPFNDDSTNIIKKADEISENILDIFSVNPQKVNKIDWHLDYRSNFRWPPGKCYRNYKTVNLLNNADVKVPWELSRSHHLLVLGQAYLLTKDEKYVITFCRHISSWIDDNPFMKSINWTCTMEVAIRAVNWIYALKMVNDSKQINEVLRKKIYISLYEHGYFIFRNPESSSYNNHNHYLADLSGQIHLGLFFKNIPEAQIWLKDGIYNFYKEIRNQILPTGSTYERSINYHRLVTEIIAYTIINLEKQNYEIPSDIKYRVETMLEFILYYLRPDGTAPIIGDQDDGRFLPFSFNKNIDHRYLLTIAAIYFLRNDFKAYSNGYNCDSYFLLGENSKNIYDSLSDEKKTIISRPFRDAGFFIMRHLNNYMFINLSGKGRYPEVPAGTHTHSDLLSFDLTMQGIPLIVDSGTYLYSANPKDRQLFRSTAMHNTVVVDSLSQNTINKDSLWDFTREAIPFLESWISNDDFDYFKAYHTGYERLNDPVRHSRAVRFDKKVGQFQIEDFLFAKKLHDYKVFFHFDDQVELNNEKEGYKIWAKSKKLLIADMIFESDKRFTVKRYNDFISKAYGSKVIAPVIAIEIPECAEVYFKTTITQKNKDSH